MSAFKGTPGPWQVVNGTDVFTRLGALNAAGVEAARNDGWHIADCYMWETETDEGPETLSIAEKRANARLIAAAPDLLDQHEADMVDLDLLAKAIHAGDPMPELVIRVTDMLNRKRAAIAKATGEQS
jgi:hypothetical protein